MQATLEAPQTEKAAWKSRGHHAFELFSPSFVKGQIDRKAGVIRGVKVLGVQSVNTARTIGYLPDEVGEAAEKPYSYAIEAMHDALGRYEGATVNVGHVDFKLNEDGSRSPQLRQRGPLEAIGTIKNCRVVSEGSIDDQGIWGDLYLHKSDALTNKIFDDVEQRVGVYKLSHEAYVSDPEIVGGRVRVGRIATVDCIALVTGKAGTVKSLIESAASTEMKTTTIRAILESAIAANLPGVKAILENMGEAPIMGQEAQIPVGMDAAPPAPAPNPAQLETVTKAALGKVWMALWDDMTLDPSAKMAKAKMLLNFFNKSTMPPAPMEMEGEESGESKEPKPESKEPAEGEEGGDFPPKKSEESAVKQSPLDAKVVLECGQLLSKAGHRFDENIVKAMALLGTAEERTAFVAAMPKPVAESAASGTSHDQPIPLSKAGSTSKPVAESGAAKSEPVKGEAFAKLVLGRG